MQNGGRMRRKEYMFSVYMRFLIEHCRVRIMFLYYDVKIFICENCILIKVLIISVITLFQLFLLI